MSLCGCPPGAPQPAPSDSRNLFIRSMHLSPPPGTGTGLDMQVQACPPGQPSHGQRIDTPFPASPQGRAQVGIEFHENRHGHHQAFQARRGPRRSDRDRRARDDRDRGQGLRAPEGPHRNLPRRRIRRELPAESQNRGGGRIRAGRQGHRGHHRAPPRPARSATAKSSSSVSKAPCASARAKPTSPRSRPAHPTGS